MPSQKGPCRDLAGHGRYGWCCLLPEARGCWRCSQNCSQQRKKLANIVSCTYCGMPCKVQNVDLGCQYSSMQGIFAGCEPRAWHHALSLTTRPKLSVILPGVFFMILWGVRREASIGKVALQQMHCRQTLPALQHPRQGPALPPWHCLPT